jgi:hypothetical protein
MMQAAAVLPAIILGITAASCPARNLCFAPEPI